MKLHFYGFIYPDINNIQFKSIDEEITLLLLQKEVDGWIECITNPFFPTINDTSLIAVVNENGGLIGLKKNIMTVAGITYGNTLFARIQGEKIVGITQKQMKILSSITKKQH